MRVIPVLDVANGIVVHARGGHRAAYQPIHSVLTPSINPLQVAQAFQSQLRLSSLYVADLDALTGGEPQWNVLQGLATAGYRLLVDAGVANLDRASKLASLGIQEIIIALESLPDWSIMQALLGDLGPHRLVFSLDLRGGVPLFSPDWVGTKEVQELATHAVDLGVRKMILLDVASVGQSGGCSTLPLLRVLYSRFPDVEFTTGGGIRTVADLAELRQAGLAGALLATALHDGRITIDELSRHGFC